MIFKKINGGYLDEGKGIIWQKEQCGDKFTYKDAIEYCKSLGKNWRLPTIKELTSIINYEKGNPATKLPDIMSSNYWSATTYIYNIDYAWLVNFYNGYVYYGSKSNTYYVRAVKDYSDSVVKKKEDRN